jgi:hypothetical protein
MACLLYCVTVAREAPIVPASGVCESSVRSQNIGDLRIYWSEIADLADRLGDAESLKRAALEFNQVLREILSKASLLPFRFPIFLETEADLMQHLALEGAVYSEALKRIGDAVQYEIVGSWAGDEQTDLATPVSGKEYLKRRQEALGKITAVDTKLKLVTGDAVQEWRSKQDRRTHRWYALVARGNRERFIKALRSAGPSEGVRLRLSGPWPPSEFVESMAGDERN